MMTWRFGVATDIGGREEQQDRVDVIASPGGDDYLVVVADGMGGHHGGALAAQAVIDSSKQYFQKVNTNDPLSALEMLCSDAHQTVNEVGGQGNDSPGSTCVMLHLSADEACWVHVGDSRLYHFRKGELLTRTQDHSVVQLLVSQGEMAEHEMADSPLKNQLYMRLGGEQQPKPDFGAAQVQEGDVFMLCSDGLWDAVGHDEACAILSRQDLDEAAEQLVRLARERGGNGGDNITVAMAQLERARKKLRWFF